MDCSAPLTANSFYGTWLPAASLGLVAAFMLAGATRAPRRLGQLLPFLKTFIELDEAESSYATCDPGLDAVVTPRAKLRPKTFLLAVPATAEACVWIALSSYALVTPDLVEEGEMLGSPAALVLFALSWVWATLRPFYRPRATPRYDLFTFYAFHLTAWLVFLGDFLRRKYICEFPGFSRVALIGSFVHTIAIVTPLATLLSMPIGVPRHPTVSAGLGKTISPEDYTTLSNWFTFAWVEKLVYTVVEKDEDVWELSPMMSLRSIYPKFRKMAPIPSSLVRRIWRSSSLDLLLDAFLSIFAVFLEYASPLFLKLILDCITVVTTTSNPFEAKKARADAFVYAALLFASSVVKTFADIQHMWFGRRGGNRVKAELCALIYEKALRRRDFAALSKRDDDVQKEPGNNAADLGKLVNLMSADVDKIEFFLITLIYYCYTVPVHLTIATIFLHNLLGWAAFAGIGVFALVMPLNAVVSNIMVTIWSKLLKTRDARMSVINELISEVRFIKFFASEDLWIARALEARGKELKVLVQSSVMKLAMEFIWISAPVIVTLTTFLSFVYGGGRLTVSLAFPAIQIFALLQRPLAVLPYVTVQLVQVNLALGRVSDFLEEPDVPDFVSSLEQSSTERQDNRRNLSKKLGIENGHFKWNETKMPVGNASPSLNPWWKHWGRKDATTTAAFAHDTGANTPKPRFELHDINVVLPDGKLTVITGPTASGKTALLCAVLGEMDIIDPATKIHLPKDTTSLDVATGLRPYISYAAQTAWLEHLSIKDNILFGSKFEEDRYADVLECCALKPDMAVLEDGDETEIGARGISLSGGQKARVALARAVYARSKYILLDDPLSAVDSHTARFLYEHLLQGPLLANRTVVLVTHHLELVLPGTHYVVRMLDGRIDFQGQTNELLQSGRLSSIIAEIQAVEGENVDDAKEVREEGAKDVKESSALKNPPRKLVEEEKRATGSVRWSVYQDYFHATSLLPWVIIIFAIIAVEGLGIGQRVWVQIWGESYNSVHSSIKTMPWTNAQDIFSFVPVSSTHGSASQSGLPSADEHPFFYIGLYSALCLGGATLALFKMAVTLWCSYRASRALFVQLLDSMMYATMRWHDTTPAGRILNRFSKDFEAIDSYLARMSVDSLSFISSFILSLVAVVIIAPSFLGPAILLCLAYFQLSRIYLRAQRSLKRLESTSRSPIFAIFRETLEGITTIRAFSAEPRFLKALMDRLDNTNKFYYAYWMVNRWVMARFEWISATSILVLILLVLFRLEGPKAVTEGTFVSMPSGGSKSGYAGLLITTAMGFMSAVYWACRLVAELELELNTVERVVEYLHVPQEPPAYIENNRPPAYWPSTSSEGGFLKVENLVVRYAPELPAVLHGISFQVKAREKIGLLGRTGSGKSTLAMSLLRFVDPSEGRIFLDDIDITTIGVSDLRSRVTFIPQESVLFSGTIRDNLDPFKQYGDDACLEALKRVHLITESATATQLAPRNGSAIPQETPEQPSTTAEGSGTSVIDLTTDVAARGTNLSHGQRQLISLARALLRRAAVVIMDEATSSIDFETDTKIQITLRDEFKGACVITVAHRLKTIIDYDRLIILDNGRIVEEGTPWELLQVKEGVFKGMCTKSGMLAELEDSAQRAHRQH